VLKVQEGIDFNCEGRRRRLSYISPRNGTSLAKDAQRFFLYRLKSNEAWQCYYAKNALLKILANLYVLIEAERASKQVFIHI
ncbi:hypothetical protein, partial [Paenibacillus sp. GXUN7292]|uniref:hypothetical protein n=1 Tax=Paenibacillus sp. GXUN7292 TaxID=3422499 RepID=UPI003D7CCF3F